MSLSMSLSGKTAIVTGAAQGIGLAVARRFLADGARVVLADINEETGAGALKELAAGGNAIFQPCDVGERLDIRNLMAATIEAFEHIDILVNNAGIVFAKNFLELTEEDFDRVLRVNLKGAFLASQAAAEQMVRQVENKHPPGCIINMSSINATVAIPDQVPYTVAKGGLAQLTKVMALALAPHGIRVNAIAPGSILTPLLQAVNTDPGARDKLLSRTPIGRLGEPGEIAAVAAFLASDDAAYITAETIVADGGRLALNYTVPVPG